MNKIFAFILILILPAYAYAGFPEGEKGYDLNKIEKSFKLPCSEIGNDQCLARAVAMGGCIYSFEINKGKENEDALKKSDEVLIALLKGNKLDINSIFEKDGSIKEAIQKEAVYRINFCKDVTKLAIPKLIKKLPEGVEVVEEKLDNLTNVFPLQYLSMFEQMRKGNKN